jgi:predicted transposase YbfD/YdcC
MIGSTKNQNPEEVHMQHITVPDNRVEGIVFDISALQVRLEQLRDTRDARGKIYPLSLILTWVVLAKLSGEDKPSGIAEWVRLRQQALVEAFGCKHNRSPCLNTYRDVLGNVVTADELQRMFSRFLHDSYGGQQSVLIAIDGKTMRGTIPKGTSKGVHLLAAYLPEEGIVLAQVAVPSKSNEISAAPELIRQIDLKNKVVCGDAMLTQRELSVQVMAEGGDYIWFLKENQPTILADTQQFFAPPRCTPGWHPPTPVRQQATMTTKGHGRVERRRLTCIEDQQGFLDWPGVRQVFELERQVIQCQTGQITTETVYGITSCDPEVVSARQLLTWTQRYWGIENGLHYRRDTTLREDATRVSCDKLAEIIAIINNFVIGICKKLGFDNLPSARRTFSAQIAALFPGSADY